MITQIEKGAINGKGCQSDYFSVVSLMGIILEGSNNHVIVGLLVFCLVSKNLNRCNILRDLNTFLN